MSATTSIPIEEAREQIPPTNHWQRMAAVSEVALSFALVHVTYRAVKQFTVIGQWDGEAHTNFTPGVIMIAFTIGMLALTRRSFATYGLRPQRWSHHLSLGLACSLVLLAVEAAGWVVTGVRADFTRPPDPHSAVSLARVLGLAATAVPGFLVALAALRTRARSFERMPVALTVPLIFALVATLPLAAAHFHQPAMWLQALWLFFGAGFGEETFFRGYIQSRVDVAFGLPFRVRGFEFGVGLFVSSLFFGIIHALNTVDYFHGRFDFGWWHGVQSFFVGLFYGCVRARTGSVLPGAIMHGLSDVFARLSNLLP